LIQDSKKSYPDLNAIGALISGETIGRQRVILKYAVRLITDTNNKTTDISESWRDVGVNLGIMRLVHAIMKCYTLNKEEYLLMWDDPNVCSIGKEILNGTSFEV